ncbi:MAG: glycosyltransferase family 4 protein, partial [Hadesarchaea archaeon]|nr:glycosyltransferase family 4 protein [Hadesarchaea archaeon]
LAGKGTMKSFLRRRVRKLGVGGAVRFLGWIPYGRYVDLLNTCDIVCIPSRNEPFGIVLLEAWATGRPVVATDVGGLGENIKNLVNGVKVRPRPKSIARGINYLFDHPHIIERVGAKGKEKVRRFNWASLIKKLLKTYHRVLERRATPFAPVKGSKSHHPK